MAKLPAMPANNTDRHFFDYTTGGHVGAKQHTVQVRSRPGTPYTDVQMFMYQLLNVGFTSGEFFAGWRITGARMQEQGTLLSFPVPVVTELASFVGDGSMAEYNPIMEANEVTFQGRSPSTGRRTDLSFYGCGFFSFNKLRYTAGDGTPIGQIAERVVNELNDFDVALWMVTVDLTSPYWYNYLNINANSYWESKLRG